MTRNSSIFPFSLLLALILVGCNGIRPSLSSTATPAQSKSSGETIVSLTFDDGDADNFDIEPLLKANGLNATFYIPSGLVGTQGHMRWDQLQILQADGNEIGGHTLNHIKVEGLDLESLRHEICDDRQNLIAHGYIPVSFAYPFGNYDQQAQQMVRECGYSSARTVRGPALIPPPDPYALGATPYIVNDTTFGKLRRYVAETRKSGGGWLILIFHHVCDGCDFFSVKTDVMNQFIPWLSEQQSLGHIKVLTIGDVISATSP